MYYVFPKTEQGGAVSPRAVRMQEEPAIGRLRRLGHIALGWGLSPAFGAGSDPTELDFVIMCH